MGEELPIGIAAIVGLIGVFGLVAGLIAANGIRREREILESGEVRIAAAAGTGWGEKTSPDAWLAAEGLQADSHFGDRLRLVWGGWMAGRVPTLMELHNLSNARERRRLWGRLAGGITGLLVVGGIAGTLFCIHPILDGFKISGDAAGVVDSSKRAESAMAMIQSLGRAFWPSLMALVFTFVVASGRGYYLHAASKLAWELDRFSADVLFSSFRVRTFGDELGELQVKLSKLIDRIEVRDKRVEGLVDALGKSVTGLDSAGSSLKTAAESVTKAVVSLGTEVSGVRSDFSNHLGPKSPVITGLATFATAALSNQQSAQELRETADALGAASEATTKRAEEVSQHLQKEVSSISENIQRGCAAGAENLLAASRDAAAAGALTIVTAAGNAAASLSGAVADAPRVIGATTAQAVQTMVESCERAADAAAGKVAQAAESAAESLRKEVEPIGRVAAEIDGANATLQTEVRTALQTSVEELRESNAAILNKIHETIGTTAEQLVSTQQAATDAVAVADRLLERVDHLKPKPPLAKRVWQQMTGWLRKKS
jgi:hypothetical protein